MMMSTIINWQRVDRDSGVDGTWVDLLSVGREFKDLKPDEQVILAMDMTCPAVPVNNNIYTPSSTYSHVTGPRHEDSITAQ